MSSDIPISDQVNIELDRRKIGKLIEDGVVTREDIANAPIVEVSGCCKATLICDFDGSNVRCKECDKPTNQ